MELRDYIRTLRKGWIFIAALTLAGLAAGALSSILATPTYVSSTRLFVSIQSSDSSTAGDAPTAPTRLSSRALTTITMTMPRP